MKFQNTTHKSALDLIWNSLPDGVMDKVTSSQGLCLPFFTGASPPHTLPLRPPHPPWHRRDTRP